MIKIKPFLHKGTRDFLPEEVEKRNFIFDTIKHHFHLYGFVAIETPAIERLEILTGKYGEEGDKLLFKILNSGDYTQKIDWNNIDENSTPDARVNYKKLTPYITEKGLRYDLTVPLARYVVMNQNELVFPFRRYHIGPVWRADRPGKGRFQEFYQCDADIVGTTSLLSELDLTNLIIDVFNSLGLNVIIKLNNRKIIEGIANVIGFKDNMNKVIVIIDKLDKIGIEGVKEALRKDELMSETSLEKLIEILSIKSLEKLETIIGNDSMGKIGIEELQYLFNAFDAKNIEFDITLARGLDYYTGCIFEVVSKDVEMGSILGGGRYDNLTEVFGGKDLSGVGISFGIERIYEVMKAKDLFPAISKNKTKILITYTDEKYLKNALELLDYLRKKGIASELYPSNSKLEKQMKYANGKKIDFVIFFSDKDASHQLIIKNMDSGVQENIEKETIEKFIKK